MSEQKYYVFLSPLGNGNKPFYQFIKHGFMGELVGCAKCNTKNKDGRYENKYSRFTKSELAEIMDGAILKKIPGGTPLDDLEKDRSHYRWIDDCNYWINPLIELVPVEEEE
ncbi:hypothetical protein LMK05_07885 [Lactococcus petauri]|nr:hypothetical protein LMK05_07885 [Lactococcus petauri]